MAQVRFASVWSMLRRSGRVAGLYFQQSMTRAFGFGFSDFGEVDRAGIALTLMGLVVSGAGVLAVAQQYVKSRTVIVCVFTVFSMAMLYGMGIINGQHESGTPSRSIQKLHSLQFCRWATFVALLASLTILTLQARGLLDLKSTKYTYQSQEVRLSAAVDFPAWCDRQRPANGDNKAAFDSLTDFVSEKAAKLNEDKAPTEQVQTWVIEGERGFDTDFYPFDVTLNVPAGTKAQIRLAFLVKGGKESELDSYKPLAFALDDDGNPTKVLRLADIEAGDKLLLIVISKGTAKEGAVYKLVK